MKRKSMITKFIVDVVSMVIISLLLYHHQYFLAVFFLIMFIEFSFEYVHLAPIRKEIAWIKDCLMGDMDKQFYKDEHNFYNFIVSRFQEKAIKKGMDIDDIYKILNEQIEISIKNNPKSEEYHKTLKHKNETLFLRENRGQDESIEIYGYLTTPLATRLQLRFRNYKLLAWEFLSFN